MRNRRRKKGEADETIILIDDNVEMLHKRVALQAIPMITEMEYYVQDCTALLDTIGKTIYFIGNIQKFAKEEDKGGKVLFVITSDGYENSI